MEKDLEGYDEPKQDKEKKGPVGPPLYSFYLNRTIPRNGEYFPDQITLLSGDELSFYSIRAIVKMAVDELMAYPNASYQLTIQPSEQK